MIVQPRLSVSALNRNRKNCQTEISCGPVTPGPKWKCQRQFAKTNLDRQFPNAARAEQDFISGIVERCANFRTKTLRIIDCPDQCMGVDDGFHFMYPSKSSSGASKSGAM